MAPLRYTLPCILAAVALVQASALRGVAPERNETVEKKDNNYT